MRVFVFDTETAPCLTMAQRLWAIDPDAPDAYERAAAARLKETEGKGDFQKAALHRIIGLGCVGLDFKNGAALSAAYAGENEGELICRWHSWLKDGPIVVTFNGLSFDFAVLRCRALYHVLPLPRFYGAINQKNYEKYDYRYGDRHYDLCDLLSGNGRAISLKLSEAAALCGLPCKTEGSGDGVLALWKAGDFEQIKLYVGEDATVTARIFLRWWVSTGRASWKEIEAMDEQLAGTPALATA